MSLLVLAPPNTDVDGNLRARAHAEAPLGRLAAPLAAPGHRNLHLTRSRPADLRASTSRIGLGGPKSAYDSSPAMLDELHLVESALALALPTLGICLGPQPVPVDPAIIREWTALDQSFGHEREVHTVPDPFIRAAELRASAARLIARSTEKIPA